MPPAFRPAPPPTPTARPPAADVAGAPPAPVGEPGIGADAASVRTEGVEFPFPGYLRNLVAQVYRRWRPPRGGRGGEDEPLEAELLFFVHRDGSVTDLRFIQRSGSFAFDLEAQGAVEAAARAGAFGRLPDGYGANVLPVSFFFRPGVGR
jgi:protein TonB